MSKTITPVEAKDLLNSTFNMIYDCNVDPEGRFVEFVSSTNRGTLLVIRINPSSNDAVLVFSAKQKVI